MEKQVQKKTSMMVICLFLGFLGVHRYMMGHKNWWLMAITLGGCGSWQLIDLILIANGGLKMADGQELVR